MEFDSDCREGICGSCGFVINGNPHGPDTGTTVCMHMRQFKDGDTVWSSRFAPKHSQLIRDLVIDRSAPRSDQGRRLYYREHRKPRRMPNSIPVSNTIRIAFAAAACIGCGACVAACKNAFASLFTAAKICASRTPAAGATGSVLIARSIWSRKWNGRIRFVHEYWLLFWRVRKKFRWKPSRATDRDHLKAKVAHTIRHTTRSRVPHFNTFSHL